jgi:hypothetical protein
MIMEKYPLIVCYREYDSDILFAEFVHNLKVTSAVAKEIVANCLDFTKGKKHYFILDISNVRDISADAKGFLQQPETGLKNILGAAFIATNPVSALIANIVIKTPKNFPAKFFSNREAATQWINDCKQKTAVR